MIQTFTQFHIREYINILFNTVYPLLFKLLNEYHTQNKALKKDSKETWMFKDTASSVVLTHFRPAMPFGNRK